MDGGRGVVTSAGNILQENGVERGTRETSDGVWNPGTGSLDGDVVVLFKIDTGVLLGGVIGVTKKLFLQTLVTPAYDMGSVLPSTVTGRWFASSTAMLLLRGVPTSSRVGSFPTPPTATSVGCDMAAARASVMDRLSRKGVVTAKRGCRRAGVVPAVPKRGVRLTKEMGVVVLTQ